MEMEHYVRIRSLVTLPGCRTGQPFSNARRTLPKEVLTPDQDGVLLCVPSLQTLADIRDPALLGVLHYDAIDGASAKERLEWLRRNEQGYVPQIYEQLAAVYRRSG